MMKDHIEPNNPEDMKVAREGSWLCQIFQSNNADVEEKKRIIKECIKDFKTKREEERHG